LPTTRPERRDRRSDEIGSVVEQEVRRGGEHARHVLVVVGGRVALPRVDEDPGIVGEHGGDAVVGRRRAAGDHEFRPARAEHLDENRRLRLDVQTHPDTPSGEGTLLRELVTERREDGHVEACPLEHPRALVHERGVLDAAPLQLRERGGVTRGSPIRSTRRSKKPPCRGRFRRGRSAGARCSSEIDDVRPTEVRLALDLDVAMSRLDQIRRDTCAMATASWMGAPSHPTCAGGIR
jgi:hypothetical protein